MLRFEWQAFITSAVVAQLALDAGVGEDVVAAHTPRLAQLLGHVGGLPFIETEPTLAQRTAHGLALFDEALGHAVTELGLKPAASGWLSEADATTPSAYTELQRAHPTLDANRASLAELQLLPGISASIARAALAERDGAGRFANLRDFEQRVDGIGPVRAAAWAGVLTFGDAQTSAPLATDRAARLRRLMALRFTSTAEQAFGSALDAVLSSVASQPHPATREGRLRPLLAPSAASGDDDAALPAELATPHAAEWIGELFGEDYWAALPALIAAAQTSVVVCMFHVAASDAKHPTHALLQALAQAHQRGVAVRVLLDRDGKADPYLSTLINSAARRFLLDAGVPCRSDSSALLLHSKYLVIDGQQVVLGSHNWSAGSYFNFDDLTLVLPSTTLATELMQRFEGAWATAS